MYRKFHPKLTSLRQGNMAKLSSTFSLSVNVFFGIDLPVFDDPQRNYFSINLRGRLLKL